jgi:hypothetical protein
MLPWTAIPLYKHSILFKVVFEIFSWAARLLLLLVVFLNERKVFKCSYMKSQISCLWLNPERKFKSMMQDIAVKM